MEVKRKQITMPLSGVGARLRDVLQRAAGLQDHRVKTLEVRLSCKEAITFTAEIYGTAEDIEEGLKLAEEQTPEEMVKILHDMARQ